jgi:hypothetical protein
MLQGSPDELAHVLVSERVVDVLALATAADDALGVEHAQLLREGRELGLARCRELADTAFSRIELMKQAKPREVAGGSKERGRSQEGSVAHPRRAAHRCRVGAAPVRVDHCRSGSHFHA